MELKDNWEDCGVEVCYNGLQCLRDNGYTKYCNDCACKTCTRGKCHINGEQRINIKGME